MRPRPRRLVARATIFERFYVIKFMSASRDSGVYFTRFVEDYWLVDDFEKAARFESKVEAENAITEIRKRYAKAAGLSIDETFRGLQNCKILQVDSNRKLTEPQQDG